MLSSISTFLFWWACRKLRRNVNRLRKRACGSLDGWAGSVCSCDIAVGDWWLNLSKNVFVFLNDACRVWGVDFVDEVSANSMFANGSGLGFVLIGFEIVRNGWSGLAVDDGWGEAAEKAK